uniref:Signal peptidase complex catalytic subunit SEC11 n=1 Tax=Pyramimonas obovata TaxID=1411642 RepID=A0A6T7YSY8_9CHLO|mmetsp:Transcript_5672/g.11559  ORF Transcript_5672/g.11559 Transcript_5672/m.11559 type:complete len:182 (+) Transcript_5672:167-712(+)
MPNIVSEVVYTLRTMQKRQYLMQGVSLGLIVTSALIIWRTLMLVTGSESPVVVVLSGSMEPAFYRGDILFLNLGNDPIRIGEIVVFNVEGRDIPIVHRVVKVHERHHTGHLDILTKGDNNYGDDKVLYAQGQEWLNKKHIMGRSIGFLPYVGMVTIVMNDFPYIKYLLIVVLGVLVVTSKD